MIHRDVWVTFETLYIVSNSSNVETVVNRLPILLQALNGLEKWKSLVIYESVVRDAVKEYNKLYYDHVFQEEWLFTTMNPEVITSGWPTFVDNVHAGVLIRYSKKEEDTILN